MTTPRLRSTSDAVDAGRLLTLVDAFAKTRVVVFGDLIVDEFIYGELSRVSREAPVLILDYDSTDIVPGGAGNAASNVAALDAPAGSRWRCRTRRHGPAASRRHAPARQRGRSGSPGGLPDADQDTHPRGGRALRQATGRSCRSRHAPHLLRRRPTHD